MTFGVPGQVLRLLYLYWATVASQNALPKFVRYALAKIIITN